MNVLFLFSYHSRVVNTKRKKNMFLVVLREVKYSPLTRLFSSFKEKKRFFFVFVQSLSICTAEKSILWKKNFTDSIKIVFGILFINNINLSAH